MELIVVVATSRVRELFDDARLMHRSALERLDVRDVRDAADKAWCATKRATDALILARTGEEPGTTALSSDGLDALARVDQRVRSLVGRYYSRISQLHGQCFYDGRCGAPDTERRIRETSEYITDAERLAE